VNETKIAAKMNKEQKQAHDRSVAHMEEFKKRAIEKGDRGIKKYGGGLSGKNTLQESLNESYDLAQYLMELEQQINSLVFHAEWAARHLQNEGYDISLLLRAIDPFNQPAE
jgi:hypothetical protein